MKNKKLLIGLFALLVLFLTSIPVLSQQTETSVKESSDPTFESEEAGTYPVAGKPHLEGSPEWKKKSGEVLDPFEVEGKPWRRGPSGSLKSKLDWSALELSADQKVQIRQKRRDFVANIAELREKLRSVRVDLRNAIFRDQAGPEKVGELTTQLAELESEMGQKALKNLLEIKNILTPAQQEKLSVLASDFAHSRKDLNLTEDQLVQLSAIDREFSKKRRLANSKIHILIEDLKDLLFQPTVEEEQIEKLTRELTQAKKESIQLKAELLLKARTILTRSQLEKLATPPAHLSQPPHLSHQAPTEPPGPAEE